MKCSFLELYNEESTDLLAVGDAADQKLKMLEDAGRVVVQARGPPLACLSPFTTRVPETPARVAGSTSGGGGVRGREGLSNSMWEVQTGLAGVSPAWQMAEEHKSCRSRRHCLPHAHSQAPVSAS